MITLYTHAGMLTNTHMHTCAHTHLFSLLQVAKAVSHSLNNCVNCLPGQKDVDMALRSIGEASKKLLGETVSSTLP